MSVRQRPNLEVGGRSTFGSCTQRMIDSTLEDVEDSSAFGYQTTKQVVAAHCPCVALYCRLPKRPRHSAIVLSHLARAVSRNTQTIIFHHLNNNIIKIRLISYKYLITNLFLRYQLHIVPTYLHHRSKVLLSFTHSIL